MSGTFKTGVLGLACASAAMAMAVTGCATGTSGGQHPTVTASFQPDARLSGNMAILGFDTAGEIGQTRYDRAVDELSGVKISLAEGQPDTEQFLSAAATGDPPELIYADRKQIGTFASRGAIMPLDKCIADEGIEIQTFLDTALTHVTFDGNIYGVPEFSRGQVLFANSDLLSKAGLELADVDGSEWDRVKNAAKALMERQDGELSIIGYDSKLPEFLPLWVHANGGALMSDDGRTAMLNTPEVVEALTFAASIYQVQGGFSEVKASRGSTDVSGAGNRFAASALGAMPLEQRDLKVLSDVIPDAPVTFTAFKTKDGEPISYSKGSAWAIPADSSKPAAACRFIKTMTETESWMAAAQARAAQRDKSDEPFTGLLTANTEADEKIRAKFVRDTGSGSWDAGINASYTANENSFSLPANPAGAKFETIWQGAVNDVLSGKQEPRQALDQAQREAQEALDKAWQRWDSEE